jgi:outer membrane biogenesis lipoprotein LolB
MKKIDFYRNITIIVCCILTANCLLAQNQPKNKHQHHNEKQTEEKKTPK